MSVESLVVTIRLPFQLIKLIFPVYLSFYWIIYNWITLFFYEGTYTFSLFSLWNQFKNNSLEPCKRN